MVKQSRSLVLCFDGTSGTYNPTNSNVVKLSALLKKDDEEQLTFYQPGVGTWFRPGVVPPMFTWGAKMLDMAFAWYLDAHVLEGYHFLMENYRTGDKIYLFGFSRGAYTARALAGLLYKVGLLPRDNDSQVSFAYKMYKRTDAEGLKLCAGFKQTYCRTVTVEFVGVWDTVASVGLFWSPSLPFTNSNNGVKTFRHALALDENRAKFRPNYYHRSPPSVQAARLDSEHTALVGASHASLETEDVKEVWFCGSHADVGGGFEANDVERSLPDISLRWMVREVIASGYGVIFDASALLRAKIDFAPEPTTSEIKMDSIDALATLHDELKIDKIWWLLEIFPFSYSWQDVTGVWHKSSRPNMGRGRQIIDVDPHPKMHITVKIRMESQLKYKPNAVWTPNSEIYVQ